MRATPTQPRSMPQPYTGRSDMIRPDPYTGPAPTPVKRSTDLHTSVQALLRGEPLLVTDLYSTGLSLLAALRIALKTPGPSFAEQRDYRRRYQAASSNLLAPIRDHQLALRKAPNIGWFSEMYSDLPAFEIPFPQLQGLNSSWQWHRKGLRLPVIERRLHPLHGTYFPTRHEHLHLFARWLRRYSGARDRAVDVGTGCGVLALQLDAAGFSEIVATDINENAIEGLRRDLALDPPITTIEPRKTWMIGPVGSRFDLIVFNPPWLPGEPKGLLDQAIYYPPRLFDDFFAAAWRALRPDGRMVLLFSNLLQTVSVAKDGTQPGRPAAHPIVRELKRRKRFEKVRLLEQPVGAASKKTRRRKRTNTGERVQLWELRRRSGGGA